MLKTSTIILESSAVHSGNYSLKMEGPTSGNRYVRQELQTITPGVHYIFRCYVLDNDDNVSVRVWHRFRDASNNILSTISSDYTGRSGFQSPALWLRSCFIPIQI
ncbi:MAG: hypothetical protein P8184_17670 [Calditrichia bacterium]